ncbi:MAG TPA: methylated-DNA--[protein]-cysteine S-methyltransferase, partial [Candidatus Fimisoma avicola]|nr:methylated-DNA--[protein]-cysteine S-methyltransferase [Candidatus Fimisoma avicola]
MYRTSYDSPLGKMYMSGDGKYLTGLWFEGSRDSRKHGQDFEDGELPVFDETKKWLDIYFSGNDPGFTPEYKLENLTDFRQMVVEEMNSIPYGQTVTYNDIARKIAEKKGLKKM